MGTSWISFGKSQNKRNGGRRKIMINRPRYAYAKMMGEKKKIVRKVLTSHEQRTARATGIARDSTLKLRAVKRRQNEVESDVRQVGSTKIGLLEIATGKRAVLQISARQHLLRETTSKIISLLLFSIPYVTTRKTNDADFN